MASIPKTLALLAYTLFTLVVENPALHNHAHDDHGHEWLHSYPEQATLQSTLHTDETCPLASWLGLGQDHHQLVINQHWFSALSAELVQQDCAGHASSDWIGSCLPRAPPLPC